MGSFSMIPQLFSSLPLCTLSRSSLPTRTHISHEKFGSHDSPPRSSVQCMVATKDFDPNINRRTANYQPSIWDYDYVQSLRSEYVGESYTRRVNKLKDEVRMMLDKTMGSLNQLELIDILQKLGLSYHFKDEIERMLKSIYHLIQNNDTWEDKDLYATSLKFRLLRQHGYTVSQEVFKSFTNESGNFKAQLSGDIKGMLYMYEASYLSVEGESILEGARDFTTKHLEEFVKKNKDQYLSILASHALELPLYWRMPRLEARWYIDVYERSQDMNSILLELAKLDFNMVQATHQEDLRHVSSWWRSMGLGENLSFARDRLTECFLWTVGLKFEPQFGYFRRMMTKVVAFITVIDDVYDVYGTLDELELFTDAVERWDINVIEELPDYMKICFYALYNSVNEMAFDTLKDQGFNIISYLKNGWAGLCKSYLQEAKWYYSGYTPTLQEYVNNAWISISGPVVLAHSYFLVTNPIKNEALQCLEEYHNIIRWSAMILRFADDLGTSSDELKRVDVPKSIQCYMHETGASEEDARQYIQHLIGATWKKMNKDRVANSPFSETFISVAMNLARMAQYMYQYGDGHGAPDLETNDRVVSLIIQPIPLYVHRD